MIRFVIGFRISGMTGDDIHACDADHDHPMKTISSPKTMHQHQNLKIIPHMKIQSKPFAMAFVLLICVSFAWGLGSCSANPISSAKAQDTQPNLVGGWVHEGELLSLSLREDGTCELEYFEPGADGPRINVKGSWMQEGSTLTLKLGDPWRGKKSHTLFLQKCGGYVETAAGKKYPCEALAQREGGKVQILFFRVWP